MKTEERRHNHRYLLHHPISLHFEGDADRHQAEILDAGVHGMRVQLKDMPKLPAGHTMEVSCQSVNQRMIADRARVVLRCQVVWKDAGSGQIGLAYQQ